MLKKCTVTKTFLHATMHLKFFEKVFIKSHTAQMSVQWLYHSILLENRTMQRGATAYKNGYSVFILQCKGDKLKYKKAVMA